MTPDPSSATRAGEGEGFQKTDTQPSSVDDRHALREVLSSAYQHQTATVSPLPRRAGCGQSRRTTGLAMPAVSSHRDRQQPAQIRRAALDVSARTNTGPASSLAPTRVDSLMSEEAGCAGCGRAAVSACVRQSQELQLRRGLSAVDGALGSEAEDGVPPSIPSGQQPTALVPCPAR